MSSQGSKRVNGGIKGFIKPENSAAYLSQLKLTNLKFVKAMNKLGQLDGKVYLIDFGWIDEYKLSHVLSTEDFPTSVEQTDILVRIEKEMGTL